MSSSSTPTVGPLDPGDATPLPLQPGELVAGRYEILRLLGSGGSAFVYAVRDRKIGDEIALKLLRKAARSEIDVKRTQREAEFARGSASARLVRTFDLVEADGLVFLTMELVSGGSLRELLRRGPLPVDEAIRFASEILEALAALHAVDVVHRDLKPGNLLLTGDGHVKLSDFGIARRWTDEDARLTRTGLPVGTVDYLSPEQAAAEPVDPRADLYSFGVVLFEMLTGRVPFEAPSAVGSIVMRLQRRADDVRKLRPEVPRWLAAIVARLLERKRENRYASAQAVLQDLRGKRMRLPRRLLRFAMVALAVLAAGIVMVRWRDRQVPLPRLAASSDGLRAVDPKGNSIWTRRDVRSQYATLVRQDDSPILAAVLAQPGAGLDTPVFSRTLSFLDPRTGHVVRTRNLPAFSQFWFPEHSGRFGVAQVLATDIDHDGYSEVIVSYTHDYWPCFVMLYDLRRDEARALLIAAGHHRVAGTMDLDADGVDEIIFSGIANRQGWYNALGALRVTLDEPPEAVASTPERIELVRDRSLLWYALLPPGPIRETRIDRLRRIVHLQYESGMSVDIDRHGLDPASTSKTPPGQRNGARELAYAQLRDAVRLTSADNSEAATAAAAAAHGLAVRAGDASLTEWSDRVRGVALIRAKRFAEADALFTDLARSGTTSEIAWDAAHAFHLEGELPLAVRWYRRNLGEGRPGVGRLKYEGLEGLVLALGEMGRWSEALAEIERHPAAFPNELGAWNWYRRYVEWRTGGTTAAAPLDAWQDPIDAYRYWSLEIALARGHDPAQLLRAIDADGARASETRSLLLVARAEALRRLGRVDEALEVAREAFLLVRAGRRTSVLAHAHFDLAAERRAALAEAKGLFDEAKQVRAEAAALRWHPNGNAR